ncbi:MAG: bifunctional glycosyltransferase family 2/GtrA family protein [Candidatus Paceibacterota bacterium]
MNSDKSRSNGAHHRVLSVIIPCYNEAATIAEVVRKVADARLPDAWAKEIILVDDGSDGPTVSAICDIEESISKVIFRKKNGGKGAALKDGLRVASGDHCIVQDADLELDPAEYINILQPVISGRSDAVFGYRSISPKHASYDHFLFYGGRTISLLYNFFFLTKFRDIPCCYKLFPKKCIPALLRMPSDDFVFDAVEMTHVIDHQCLIEQVSVNYLPRSREQGKKLRMKHGIYGALAIVFLRLGLHHDPIEAEAKRFFRFIISGLVGVAVNLGVLYLLTEKAHQWYLASSVAAVIISYAINFSLHKYWTFENSGAKTLSRQLSLHFSIFLFNLVLNTLMIYVLVEYLRVWYFAAQIAAAAVIAIEDYFLFSKFVFIKRSNRNI